MLRIVIIGIIILGGGVLFLTQTGGDAGTKSKRSLTALSFLDYEGNTVALADFAGKPMVINTWAAWCPFCVKELPAFSALQKAFPEELVVIAIDRVESLSTVKSYTDDLGITDDLLFLLDRSDSFYKSIGGFSMPETIFVDREGVIQDHKRGPMELSEMKQRVEKIL
ncbi:TlpA family protein disulfide reductase [Patescibacteria group bacterium]|nr:TlpA family protein disulfide reductase [Patescibacteria group bacterium]